MDIDSRLAAIEETQNKILRLLANRAPPESSVMTLKQAAEYVGFSPDHFRRLAVEQRSILFSRPSGQQKGKLLFRRSDLDNFLDTSAMEEIKNYVVYSSDRKKPVDSDALAQQLMILILGKFLKNTSDDGLLRMASKTWLVIIFLITFQELILIESTSIILS